MQKLAWVDAHSSPHPSPVVLEKFNREWVGYYPSFDNNGRPVAYVLADRSIATARYVGLVCLEKNVVLRTPPTADFNTVQDECTRLFLKYNKYVRFQQFRRTALRSFGKLSAQAMLWGIAYFVGRAVADEFTDQHVPYAIGFVAGAWAFMMTEGIGALWKVMKSTETGEVK